MINLSKLEILKKYVQLGLAIIPIQEGQKNSLVKWEGYQHKAPSLDQVLEWYKKFPNCNWAVITGNVSNIMVVDCDNREALNAAEELEITSSVPVKTPNGWHHYFRLPHDGKLRKTISGHGSKGTYWPQVKGLDLRYEGGYALLPPSVGYEWEIELENLEEELTVYKDWAGATFEEEKQPELTQSPPLAPMPLGKFSDIDLTNVNIEPEGRRVNKTREKWDEISEQYPDGKVPRKEEGSHSGIHDATFNFLAEEALIVGIGPELEAAGRKFMEDFFETPLNDGRFETSLQTVRDKERTNHPERFDANGNYVYHLQNKGVELSPPPIQPISNQPSLNSNDLLDEDDAEQYAEGDDIACWQSPWLPKASIIQVYGYSGHGKSLFLQHALHHAAAGLHFGPFRHIDTPKILYLDFENGRTTWGKRIKQMKNSFGRSKPNMKYWTPWHNNEYINLRTNEGMLKVQELLQKYEPDILVIDTLRSAYPGLKENSAEEWAAINNFTLRVRNAGCTVILVHHSNKPDKDGFGREAGSSNQLTTLETQMRITQVLEDADLAKSKGAIYTGDLKENPFHYLKSQLPKDSVMKMVMEVSYGKVREWTDLHDPKQYLGIGVRPDGRSCMCQSDGPKERLRKLITKGKPRDQIIGILGRPVQTLEQWAKEMGIKLPKN